MQQLAIQYLALDVHQATVVATHRHSGGAIQMRATVTTEARAIVRLVKSCGPLRNLCTSVGLRRIPRHPEPRQTAKDLKMAKSGHFEILRRASQLRRSADSE